MTDPTHRSPRASTARVWFVAARAWLGRFPLSILQLGLRIGVGMVFFNAGLLKYRSFEFAVKLFEDEYKVPLVDPTVAARLAMFNELTFPVLLFVGLATRAATLPLLGMIAVIQTFVYPHAWPDHVLWGSALVFLLTRGPGALSLDHLIEHRAINDRARSEVSHERPRRGPPGGLGRSDGATY
jgi:putative oxidoreductase